MKKNKNSIFFLLAAVVNFQFITDPVDKPKDGTISIPNSTSTQNKTEKLATESYYFRKIPEEWSKQSDKLYVYTGKEDILLSVQIEKSKKNLKFEEQVEDWKKTLELAKLKILKTSSGLMQDKIPWSVIQSQDTVKKSEQFQWISSILKEYVVITCMSRKAEASQFEKLCQSFFNEFRWKSIPKDKS